MKPILAFLVLITCIAVGCKPNSQSNPTATPKGPTHQIVAVSYPLQYLTQRIVGDAISVDFPVPTSADPQSWRPSREAIGQMQSADLIIANGQGATYANWLTLVSLPDSKVRNCATKVLKLKEFIAVDDVTITHSHGPEGEHSHATMVARTWLDPMIAKKQAVFITEQLKNTYPELADQFDANLKQLSLELDDLSKLLAGLFPNEHKQLVFTATPRSKFLARATGAGGPHFIWFEPPTKEAATQAIDNAYAETETDGGIVLFQQEPAPELNELLISKKLTPITINLIDFEPSQGDFLTEMRLNIERMKNAISQ